MKSTLKNRARIVSMGLALTLMSLGSSHGLADLWRIHMDAGNAFYASGCIEEAEREFQASLNLTEADPDGLSAVAMNLNNLAMVRVRQARLNDAVALFRRAATIVQAQSGPSSPELARILNNEATTFRKMGDHGQADTLFRRALDVQVAVHGPTSPEVACTLNNLALNLASQSRYTEAYAIYRQALAIDELRLGPDHRDVGATLNNLALLLANVGRYADAEALGRRELRIFEAAYGPIHPNVTTCLTNLARFAREQGHLHESEQLLQRANLRSLPSVKGLMPSPAVGPVTAFPAVFVPEVRPVGAPVVAPAGSPQMQLLTPGATAAVPAPPPNVNGPGSPGAQPLSWIQRGGQLMMDGQETPSSFSVEGIAGEGSHFVAVIRFKNQTYVVAPGAMIPSRDDPALQIRMITAEGVDAFDPIALRVVRRSLSNGISAM